MPRYDLKSSTQCGEVILYWPQNMPADLQKQAEEDLFTLVDQLKENGQIIHFASSLGENNLSLFFNDDIPDPLSKYLEDEQVLGELEIVGPGVFCGVENLQPVDEDDAPALADEIELPNGVFQAKAYATKYPSAFSRDWIAQRMGTRNYRILYLQQLLSKAAMIGLFVGALAFVFLPWIASILVAVAVAATFYAALRLSRSEACQVAIEVIDEFTVQFPDFVVVVNSSPGLAEDDPDPESHALLVGTSA